MKFYWLRDERNNPVAVVASEDNKEAGVVNFSLAIFNPKDDFDKVRGRAIAEGRLQKGKRYATLLVDAEIKHNLMRALEQDEALPMRIRRAAGWWLKKHPHKAA
jgi:hypothetical protein